MPKPRADRKDRRILRELDRDSRQSYTAIAKRLSMPAETVRYRVQKLLEQGAIRNFLTVIDGGRLGYYYYKVFFKLHNVDERIVQEIIAYLEKQPEICWVVRVDEVYDLGFTPRVSGPAEQSRLMDSLRQRYAKYILGWTLSVNVAMEFLTRDYLTGTQRKLARGGSYGIQRAPFRLDASGRGILDALSRDARASAREIAAGLPIGPDAVLDRIEELERERVIVRYSCVLDCDALAQVNYYVLIHLNHISAKRDAEFQAFCRSEPNIVYLIKALGRWDYEISIEAPDVATYRELMQRMNREFSDIIQHCTGMLVRRIHKYTYP